MPCTCLDVFQNGPQDVSRVKFIDAERPECVCEAEKVSPYSDPVRPDEMLVRLVVDPIHIHYENGVARLRNSFFSDSSSVGSSCLRKEYARRDEYEATIEAMLKSSPKASDGSARKLYGVVLVAVADVKKIMHEIEVKVDPASNSASVTKQEIQGFCVYGTGEQDRPSHTDIMVNGVNRVSNSKARRAQARLTKAVTAYPSGVGRLA